MHVVITHRRAQLVSIGLLAFGSAMVGMSVTNAWGVTEAMIVVALGVAASAAVIDLRTGRIPNRLVSMAGVPSLVVVIVAFADARGSEAIASVCLGVAAFAGPVLMVHLVSPPAIGFGDVKLATALGAVLGLVGPGLGLLALCIASAVTAGAGLLGRHRALPFGPGLVAGAVTALLIAERFGEGALQWR